MESTKNFDISKSVRFDSRKLATIGSYLITDCGYNLTTSTDLIRTAIDKLYAIITNAGYTDVKSYAESREWFLSHGLGDLFKQGNKVNVAHVTASAKENEMFASLRAKSVDTLVTSDYEQDMIDVIESGGEPATLARELTTTEPESRRGDIDGIANLMNEMSDIIGE